MLLHLLRTLFGTLHLRSPRWWHCSCQPQPTRTFSPLVAVVPSGTTPELIYLESKFSGLISYGRNANLLPFGHISILAAACRTRTWA